MLCLMSLDCNTQWWWWWWWKGKRKKHFATKEKDKTRDGKWSAKGDAFAYFPHISMILYLSTLIQIIACAEKSNNIPLDPYDEFFSSSWKIKNNRYTSLLFSVYSLSDLCHLGVCSQCKKSERQIAQSIAKQKKMRPICLKCAIERERKRQLKLEGTR